MATALAACSSGSSDDPASDAASGSGAAGGDTDGNGSVNQAPVIEGDITRYGMVNVTDDSGQASEAIATFNRVQPGVGALAFGTAADPTGAPCTVVPSDSNGNDLLLVGYAPEARGAQNTSILAGDTITLTSAEGTWATLTAGSASSVAFYDGPVPAGAVPPNLQVDVSAAADAQGYPGVAMAALPSVTPLTGFGQSPAGSVGAGTSFSWNASDDPASRVRIVASTGFFGGEQDGKRVSCLVPDTGSFAFPADTREQLGSDYAGELFAASRVAIGTEQSGDSLLFLIRESFTAD